MKKPLKSIFEEIEFERKLKIACTRWSRENMKMCVNLSFLEENVSGKTKRKSVGGNGGEWKHIYFPSRAFTNLHNQVI